MSIFRRKREPTYTHAEVQAILNDSAQHYAAILARAARVLPPEWQRKLIEASGLRGAPGWRTHEGHPPPTRSGSMSYPKHWPSPSVVRGCIEDGDNTGWCHQCGTARDGIPMHAQHEPCEGCGQPTVDGISPWLSRFAQEHNPDSINGDG